MEWKIETVAFGGEGVARDQGLVVFVPFTLPQETIEGHIVSKKKNFAKGMIDHIIHPHPERVPPPCPYFTRCGGCQLQQASYPLQLEIKHRFLVDSLTRIGKVTYPIPPIQPSQEAFFYRRHITLGVERKNSSWHLCFMENSHQPIPITQCLLWKSPWPEMFTQITQALSQLSLSSSARCKLLDTPQGLVIGWISSTKLPKEQMHALQEALSPLCYALYLQTPDTTKCLQGPSLLTVSCLGEEFFYHPFVFMQAHASQQENILTWVLQKLANAQTILDLYCGIGISSLLLEKQGKKVIGMECNADAIALAKQTQKHKNLLRSVFLVGTVEHHIEKLLQEHKPDAILVNPPKEGLETSLRTTLAQYALASTLVYISCHPPTLARDLIRLLQEGWIIEDLQGFDHFPQTTHVETVVCLHKKPLCSQER